MWNKYDTMSKELYKALVARFSSGERSKGKFYLNESNSIRHQDCLVIVEFEDEVLKDKVEIFINEFAAINKLHWIIIFINKESHCTYLSTTPEAKVILKLLLSINNLTNLFEFDKKIFYHASIKINMQEGSITFLTDKEKLITIKNMNDVEKFNATQDALIKEISQYKKEILQVVQTYRKKAYYSKFDILNMYNQDFICKFQKTNNYWKVAFYKKFDLNFIFVTAQLEEIKKDLLELADKHAREERFVALVRPDYDFCPD